MVDTRALNEPGASVTHRRVWVAPFWFMLLVLRGRAVRAVTVALRRATRALLFLPRALDADDRRILGQILVGAASLALALLFVSALLGLAVRIFLLTAFGR